MSRPPLFAWPPPEELRRTSTLAAGFVLFFLLVYGGASWVTGFYPGGVRVDLPFERHIPFVFATGYGEQAQIPQQHRGRSVIQKPYTIEIVARTVAALLANNS